MANCEVVYKYQQQEMKNWSGIDQGASVIYCMQVKCPINEIIGVQMRLLSRISCICFVKVKWCRCAQLKQHVSFSPTHCSSAFNFCAAKHDPSWSSSSQKYYWIKPDLNHVSPSKDIENWYCYKYKCRSSGVTILNISAIVHSYVKTDKFLKVDVQPASQIDLEVVASVWPHVAQRKNNSFSVEPQHPHDRWQRNQEGVDWREQPPWSEHNDALLLDSVLITDSPKGTPCSSRVHKCTRYQVEEDQTKWQTK